jgi:hypothetical protein
VRYPIPEQRRDPLIEAIAAGDLSPEQRGALADFMQLFATEMAGDNIVRPGTLLERAMDESGRWNTLRLWWDERRADLYPAVSA